MQQEIARVDVSKLFDGKASERRPHILLIDDDPAFRAIMLRLADHAGIQLEAYDSLMELDPFSRLETFDAAILDYHLVGSDGVDVVRHLRPFFQKIPTMIVSADDDAERQLKQTPGCGFCMFVSKRLGAMKILNAIRGFFGRGSDQKVVNTASRSQQ